MSLYADAVMALGPTAYLRLGESSGTTATDISGNGYHGTYHGSPTLGIPGAAGDSDTAVRFNGSGDYLTVPVPLNTLMGPPFPGGNLSIMFWCYVPVFANDNGAAMVYGTDWKNDSVFCLPNHSTTSDWGGGISSSAPFSQQTVGHSTRPSAAAWHHVLMTVEDGTGGGSTKTYIDCSFHSSTNGLGGAEHRSDKDFYIARNVTDGVDLACSIDEFAVWTRLLSDTERGSICSAIQETYGYWGVLQS